MVVDFGSQRRSLDRPLIMGVLNVTPDSFSDGGRFVEPARALEHARQMFLSGATFIDVGGESTRPGAAPVSVEQELERVVPVVEAIRAELDVVVSVDTSTAEVMQAAIAAGAGLINDVRALQRPGALQMAASLGVPVCLMHMQGEPGTMQHDPCYDNVIDDVMVFLRDRMRLCEAAGISRSNLLIDPGFGFGKTLQHNLQLLKGLSRFAEMDVPLLVGMSRKSMIGAVLDRPDADDRLYGSIAVAVLAAQAGAHIIRVHDVKETRDALAMVDAVSNS
ncbi:dihydropteroate synthase [Aestuariirhabdus haliotis]|uniref:dihydropteroate synthase n=1 Tax=Aestuariirhabdus haliotis TaxID=2918751 RepID=UPI0020BEC842|nr:dihydropteroate synthase [Aestuariirhabdus haliotis]MCL6419191.1 dihydropteroate synthase [Aestuariirhabdus haliotis]